MAWILGLVAGALIVATTSMGFAASSLLFVPFLATALTIALGTGQLAMGGGLLLALGVWMTNVHFSMIQRCAAMNGPTGSCTVVDGGGTAYPAIAFVIGGALLSLYGLGKRSVRGGE